MNPGKIALLFLSLIVCTLFAGCMPVAPTPVPPPTLTPTTAPPTAIPTPTLTPTPSSQSLIQGITGALDSANRSSAIEAHVTTFTKVKQDITRGGSSLEKLDSSEEIIDQVGRVIDGTQWNTSINRSVTATTNNLQAQAQGELRWIKDAAYARGQFAESASQAAGFPTGWTRFNGKSTLLFWPGFATLQFHNVMPGLQGENWLMFTGYSLDQIKELLHANGDKVTNQTITLEDGTTGLLITLPLDGSALGQSLRPAAGIDPAGPIAQAIFATTPNSTVLYQFTLDASGALISWQCRSQVDVKAMDLGAVPGYQQGDLLSLSLEQDVTVKLKPNLQVVVEAPPVEERQPSPALAVQTSGITPPFKNLEEFDAALNAALQNGGLETFLQQIAALKQMPLIFDDRAYFLYYGPATSVAWSGDWDDKQPLTGTHLGRDLWLAAITLPKDAQLSYHIVLNDGQKVLDPLNPTPAEWDPETTSTFAMPDYQPSPWIKVREDVARGELSAVKTFKSGNLGYEVNYRVYTPAGYKANRQPPYQTLYVTDGPDYLQYGKMVNILDNMIAENKINPIIAVFIDPRDPATGENRRDTEFLDNPKFSEFITKELVPQIEFLYRAEAHPKARALLGTSYGGYHAAVFGMERAEKFLLIAAQSPALWVNDGSVIDLYREKPKRDTKIFLSTGTISDNIEVSREWKTVLEEKGYQLMYVEANEGHNFGNWRDQLDEMLVYFFGVEEK